MKCFSSLEKWLYGRVSLQPFFESLHRLALRGQGYMQSQDVSKTGEIYALRRALDLHVRGMSVNIFDVRANDGQFLRLLLTILPSCFHVYAFEPSSIAFSKLSRLKPVTPVDFFNIGIADHSGTITLYDTGSLFATAYPIHQGQHVTKERVPVVSLDEFCLNASIGSIYYLKIDVEGGELDVLKGAQRLMQNNLIRYIQFEYGPNCIMSRHFLKDYFEILRSYRIYRILKDGLRLLTYTEVIEVPMTANFLAELID